MQKKASIDFKADYAIKLGNYAMLLSRAGRDNLALSRSKDALELFKELYNIQRDRFEPDYASALNNYSNDLADAGKHDDVLDYAKQALDIRQRLAHNKPDRFEPDYATSLSNYAIRLSEAGEDEAALKHAKQALDIRQRLAQKYEDRYIEDMFNTTCHVHFLSWLSDNTDSSVDLTDLSNIPTKIPAHRLPLSQLYASFVLACWSPTETTRAENFKNVIIAWNSLTRAHKTQAQGYRLCAAVWSAKFAPATVADVNWQTNWHQYVTQRQGRIPHWMTEIARRMEFQWPE